MYRMADLVRPYRRAGGGALSGARCAATGTPNPEGQTVKKTFRRTITVLAAGTALAGSLVAVSAAPAYADCEFPTVVSIGDARAYEGTGGGFTTLTFPVYIEGGCSYSRGSVDYTTTSGTAPSLTAATPGVDFTPTSSTLHWTSGSGSVQKITVKVAADSTDEPNEWFHVKLSNPTGYTGVSPHDGLGDILDDDGPVSWNIDDATCSEGVSPGQTPCNVKITTSKASASDMTVALTTANGSATSPADYLGVSSMPITVKAGARTAIGQIAVVNDDVCGEGVESETFNAKLTAPSTGVIADGVSVLTIQEILVWCP
jgi:hypothetical protein